MGGVALARPIAAVAQQPSAPIVGVLHGGRPTEFAPHLAALRRGLREQGFEESGNLSVVQIAAEGDPARLPALAKEMIDKKVAVIVTMGGGAVVARVAKGATSSVPIVFLIAGDPVSIGLVDSINRPGGNVTGVSLLAQESGSKRLEVIRELIPHARKIGWLANPNSIPAISEALEGEKLARTLGLEPFVIRVQTEEDVDRAVTQLRADALIVSPDGFVIARRHQLTRLAASLRMPVVYPSRDFPEVGGLVSYGTSLFEGYRQVGLYVGRILQGVKPADLPVFQLTKFELVINLKTAKVLGIEVPATLLARADEVIE
jgi:putative ABC transport system substrate-binding protein